MSNENSFFSEREEDFFDQMQDNKQKLNLVDFYEPFSESNDVNYCETLKDSILVAKQSINQIIKNTEEVLYERYLNQRKDQYAIAQTLLIGELQIKMIIQIPDQLNDVSVKLCELEDTEPPKPLGETWIRSRICVEQPLELQKYNEEDCIEKKDKTYSEKTTQSQKHNYIIRKEDAFKDDLPKILNMEIPQESDEVIERLRIIKQNDTKRKEEKEEQDKKEKQKIPMELKKDSKNIKYTYDFDGKIINTKGIKIEKLPPANYLINFQFTQQEVDKNKLKKLKAQQEEQQKLSQLQLQQQQSQQQKGKGSFLNLPQSNKDDQGLGMNNKAYISRNPFSYDDFKPNTGVTLFYDQRIKEGPKNTETFENLANLDQRLKIKEEPLHITRTEYKRLTENGNLNMAQTYKNLSAQIANQHGFSGLNKGTSNNSNNMNNENKGLDLMKKSSSSNILNNILDNQSINKSNKQSYLLSSFNNPHYSSKKQKDDMLLLSLDNSRSKIIVNSPKLINKIIISEDDNQNNNDKANNRASITKLPGIHEKNKLSLPLKSPVDDFNQTIIKGSVDWGKGNRGVGALFSGKPFYKPDQNVLRTTLNQFYKLPRERDQGQSIKTNKSQKYLQKQNKTEGNLIMPDTEFRGTFYTYNAKFSETLRSFKN